MILNDGKLRLAFYRAKHGTWMDGIINWFSSPRRGFSHNELIFPDGWSISSTMRDPSTDRDGNPIIDRKTGKQKKDGVRWKLIDFDPAKWAFYEINATPEEIDKMREFANTILQARYDFWGLFRFVPWYILPLLPFRILAKPNPVDMWCTECDIEVPQAGNHFTRFVGWRMSPNSMADELGVK